MIKQDKDRSFFNRKYPQAQSPHNFGSPTVPRSPWKLVPQIGHNLISISPTIQSWVKKRQQVGGHCPLSTGQCSPLLQSCAAANLKPSLYNCLSLNEREDVNSSQSPFLAQARCLCNDHPDLKPRVHSLLSTSSTFFFSVQFDTFLSRTFTTEQLLCHRLFFHPAILTSSPSCSSLVTPTVSLFF